MFSLISTLFGLRRSIGLGVTVAALMVSLSTFFPSKGGQAAARPAAKGEFKDNGTYGVVAIPSEAPKRAEEAEAVSSANANASPAFDKEELFKTLEIDGEGFNWRKDWWKYLCIVLVGMLGQCGRVHLGEEPPMLEAVAQHV